MFWKRKPPAAPPPEDPELADLRARVARRQVAVAELEAEWADLQRFIAEVENYLLPLQDKLETLLQELGAALGGRWSQALRRRGPAPEPDRPPEPEPAPVDEEALKVQFRALAKRFHPDLAADPAEKAARQARMAAVNAAYAARDPAALERLADAPLPVPRPAPGPLPRAAQIAELRAELDRLEARAAELERQLAEIADSQMVQLKLEASLARHRGRNLLGEIAAEIQAEIAQTETILAGRRPRA